MKNFCIIGYPVSQSISPSIYNRYFHEAGIKATYEAEGIEPENFDDEIHRILRKYNAFNVTIPFKNKILPYLTLDRDAKEMGAVNCVFDGKGYNTDWKGFVNSFEDIQIPSPITVIGAGGAARAVIYGLYRMGIKKITLLNRTVKRAQEFSQDFAMRFGIVIDVYPLSSIKPVVRETKTLINATSVGMRGERFDIAEDDLAGIEVLYDVIYLKTPLQTFAAQCGIDIVINGLSMFYHQAIENLRIWSILDENLFQRVFKKVMA